MSNRKRFWAMGIGVGVVLVGVVIGAIEWAGRKGGGTGGGAAQGSSVPSVAVSSGASGAPAGVPPAVVSRDPARPAVAFDDGTVAELVGIRTFGSGGADENEGWGADGSAVPMPVQDDAFHRSVGGFNNAANQGLEVRVALQIGSGERPGYNLQFPIRRVSATHYASDGYGGVVFTGIYGLPRELAEAELQVGLAAGAWEDKDVVAVGEAPARAAAAEEFATAPQPIRSPGVPSTPSTRSTNPAAIVAKTTPYRILSITEKDGQTYVGYTSTRYWERFGDAQWQAVVRDKSGNDRRYKNVEHRGGRMTFIYDLPMEQVQAAVYQERPWQWKSLGMVRLRPAGKAATP